MESYTQHWIELVSRWVRQVQAAEQVLRVSSGDVHRLQSAAERIRSAITEAQESAHVGPTEESGLVLHHLEYIFCSLGWTRLVKRAILQWLSAVNLSPWKNPPSVVGGSARQSTKNGLDMLSMKREYPMLSSQKSSAFRLRW